MNLPLELDRYLSVRRSLGSDLSTAERILRRFVTFANNDGATHISTELVLRWHATLANAGTSTRAARVGAVRLFAQWLSGFDPDHEVPPRGLLPSRYQRARPYIYSDAEIAAIIEHARTLPSIYGMRGLTCSTLFGLIVTTGLRINEALCLDAGDLDGEHGMLRVRHGKLGKERLLPLDPRVVARLDAYGADRDRLLGRPSDAMFVTCNGARLGDCGARYNFAQVCQQVGLRTPQLYRRHGRGPRIHDLRHTFAARTIITGTGPARTPAGR